MEKLTALYSEEHTKHINTICGKNAESLMIKAGGSYGQYSAAVTGEKTV
jgi:hypothetical protein